MDCQQLARVLKGVAEPTRLRLVCLLAQHEAICVCDLTEILGLPQYHVSRHLGVLRNLGIVEDERAGARVNYRLASENELIRQLTEVLIPAISSCPAAAADRKRGRSVLQKQGR